MDYDEIIVAVEPSMLRGGADRVRMQVCMSCGAVVWVIPLHDVFHERADRP